MKIIVECLQDLKPWMVRVLIYMASSRLHGGGGRTWVRVQAPRRAQLALHDAFVPRDVIVKIRLDGHTGGKDRLTRPNACRDLGRALPCL